MKRVPFALLMMAVVLAMGLLLAGDAVGAKPARRAGAQPADPKLDAGMLLVPLATPLTIEEGSLEVYFMPDYSFDNYLRKEQSYCVPFNFLQVCAENGVPNSYFKPPQPFINIAMTQSAGNHVLLFNNSWYYYETTVEPKRRYGSTGVAGHQERGPWFKEGEWHVLAVTWMATNSKLKVEMFIDGVRKNSALIPNKESSVRDLTTKDLLAIGNNNLSSGTLLWYRLSKRVRTMDEIVSTNQPQADDATIFYLDANAAAKFKTMKNSDYEVLSQKRTTLKAPSFVGNIKIVQTPKGKAIQFFNTRSR